MRTFERLGWLLAASGLAATTGCAAIAGLDDFSRQPEGGGGSATGGATSSTTTSDTPGGGGAGTGGTAGGAGGSVGGTGGAGGGMQCSVPADCPDGLNGTRTCDGGTCGFECATGFANCDEAVGCELDVRADAQHCGGCDTTCSAYCVDSACNDPIAVSRGYAHTCAILADGSVWCWGYNAKGQIGNNTTTDSWVPVEVISSAQASQIDANGRYMPGVAPGDNQAHSCALVGTTVTCWGANAFGQLGQGDTTSRLTPTNVPFNGIEVQQIAVGGSHTCGLTTGGDLYCWGRNESGQVGDNSTTDRHARVLVQQNVIHVSAGAAHTCAVKTDHKIYCWGRDTEGQLGNGAAGNALVPTLVSGVDNMNMDQVACGRNFACGWGTAGAICWGDNGAGALGDGTTTTRPSPVVLNLPSVDLIGPGHYHSGGIANGQLYMWGENSNNQLGDGTIVDAYAPDASTLTNVAQVVGSEHHSCAVTTNHVLYCWGGNAYGQLGDGSDSQRAVPTPVTWPTP